MRLKYIFLILVINLLMHSCSSIGLLDEKNSWLLEEINSIGDFIKVYIVLQISIFLVSLILSLILRDLGVFISIIIHLVWIINYRDYGFFIVLLLFGLFAIISHFIMLLIINRNN